ncbi:hypothetical protein IV102_05960 [bacterium]|nr:hypothetical protein [bacterium]
MLLGPTAQPANAYLERFQRGDEESKPISPFSTIWAKASWPTPQESLAGWRVADQLTQLVQQQPWIFYRAGATLEQIADP